jgi:methylthioribose-1-phosphate isomerase
LPQRIVKIRCRNVKRVFQAIKTLSVRGAPAIGVAAGYGLVLSAQRLKRTESLQKAELILKRDAESLAKARPTAVNLFWALERIQRRVRNFISDEPKANIQQLREIILSEANAIYKEDVDMCRRIGKYGQKLVKNGSAVLTHCNAGALATAGQGTAISILFEAHKRGKKFTVYVDETRPLLQGARLTAWELKQAGIRTIVICDNTAGTLMKQKKINAVITGADRIAANGDTANKIGTYSLAVLADKHKIPFYIAAPSSTFDLHIKSGSRIFIEQRPAHEVSMCYGKRITPDDVKIYNPAFDVTDAKYITSIITDKGVINKPSLKKIRNFFRKAF